MPKTWAAIVRMRLDLLSASDPGHQVIRRDHFQATGKNLIPRKWHLAHTTWFFETMVLEAAEPHFAPFDARFRMLFNSYYQGVGAAHARAERGLISRPTLVEVMRYRAQVDERMQRLLAHGSLAASVRQLVALGLHVGQQHQELLLTDMQHALSRHPQWLAGQPPAEAVPHPPLNWLPYAGGRVEQGWHPERDGDFF